MPCPNDDTYARMLQGLLPAPEVAALEQHVDGCETCTHLVAQLGKIYTPSQASCLRPVPSASSTTAVPPGALPVGSARLLQLEVGMAVAHCVWGALLVPLAWRLATNPDGHASDANPLLFIVAWYIASWGIVGTGMAFVSVLGLLRHRRWASRLAGVHASLSLPTLLLLPLGLLVLLELRRDTS